MNKFNKGKMIGVVTAALSTVSLMGVGFASWVITGNNEASTDSIEIAVADIQDKRITIDGISKTGSISFDADPADKSGDIQASDGSVCSLSFTVSYTVTPGNAVTVGGINAKFELISGKSSGTADVDALKASITNGVIVAPWDTEKLGTDYESIYTASSPKKIHTNDSKTFNLISTTISNSTSYTTTFSFVWGDSYENNNPSYKDDANSLEGSLTALRTLKEADSVKIKITLQAVAQ